MCSVFEQNDPEAPYWTGRGDLLDPGANNSREQHRVARILIVTARGIRTISQFNANGIHRLLELQ